MVILSDDNAYSITQYKAFALTDKKEYNKIKGHLQSKGNKSYTTEVLTDYQNMANEDRGIQKTRHTVNMTDFEKLHMAINKAGELKYKAGKVYIGRTRDGKTKTI